MFKLKRVQANVRLGCRGFRVMGVQTEEGSDYCVFRLKRVQVNVCSD